MVSALSGRSLGVNLLGMSYFVEGKPVCSEAEFVSERGGDKFPYVTGEQASYAVLGPMMDPEIRAKFPKKPTLVLVLNWLLLLVLFWFSLLGFVMFMLVLAMTGNGKKKAAALMARQAYIFERSARIEQAPPPGKEVDIGAHHIVMMYLEKYMDLVFSFSGGLFKIFKAAPEFKKMMNVKAFCEESANQPFAAYGWQHDEKFKPAVVSRAVEKLSVPMNGPRFLWVAIPVGIWLFGMVLQAAIYFSFSWGAALFNLLLSLLIIGLVLYLVGYYLMVTRIIEGVIGPANEKIKAGIAADPVAAVSDLAAAGAKMSLAVPDTTALPASTHYWMPLVNPGGTAKLGGTGAMPPSAGPTSTVVNMPPAAAAPPATAAPAEKPPVTVEVPPVAGTWVAPPDAALNNVAPAGTYEELK